MQASVSNVANYRVRASLVALRRDLDRSLNSQQQKIVIFELINRDLITIPWWMRPIKVMFSKIRWSHFMTTMWDQNPNLLDKMWCETMDHMVDGRDRADFTSAGGFDGGEMAEFITILKSVRYVPGNVLTVTALRENWFIDDDLANAHVLREMFYLS